MKRQKHLALANDLTGFGRCSLTVQLPLVSAMKIQAIPFPTAILSVHTGFPRHYMDDYTSRMRPYMDNWRECGLAFDGILTGFLGSDAQIQIILDFIKTFRREDTLVMVDPVMGDDGRLYSSYTKELCREMRRLVGAADLITPNLTEACELLGEPYPADGKVEGDKLWQMADALADKGPRQVVITGLSEGEHIKNFIYERNLTGNKAETLKVKKVGIDRSGTGDAFAAILAASLLRGDSLSQGIHRAALFIRKCLIYAESLGQPWNWGLPFEEYLTELK